VQQASTRPILDIQSLPSSQYQSLLDTEDTRVLVLHPGSGDEEISCHLEPITLVADSDFEALSYVWGSESQRKGIRCGDGRAEITLNLHSALKHLRLADAPRRIWADALCINQGDVEERSAQVKNMGQVFKSASRTLIWLGEETPAVAGAFPAFEAADEIFPPVEDVALPSREAIDDFMRTSFNLMSDLDWNSVVALLLHPWFKRKWIVQEVVMAKSALGVCGYRSIDWSIIERVLLSFKLYQVETWVYALKLKSSALLSTTNAMKMFFIRIGLIQRSYRELMFATRGFQSTDPRDQYFAVFGLAENVESISKDLYPDYSITFTQLTFSYVQWSLDSCKALEFLVCTRDTAALEEHGLPSWCPVFTSLDYYYGSSPSLHEYDVSKGSEVAGRVDAAKRQLHLSGRLLDEIHAVTKSIIMSTEALVKEFSVEESGVDDIGAAALTCTVEWVRECKVVAAGESGTLSPAETLNLTRTLVWDLNSQGVRATNGFPEHVSRFFDMAGEIVDSRKQDEELNHDKDWFDEFLKLSSFVEMAIAKNAPFRRFCRTKTGRLCSMPDSIEVGDKVCLFHGGPFAYAIRPCGDGQYKFIGEAYLDGFMDGEAMELDIETETIVLV
jgi:hypothetical protein